MVAVRVLLFARARQMCAADSLEVEVPAPATVTDLKRAVAALHPRMVPLMEHLLVAVNECYADRNQLLENGDTVALIPPVSGG